MWAGQAAGGSEAMLEILNLSLHGSTYWVAMERFRREGLQMSLLPLTEVSPSSY